MLLLLGHFGHNLLLSLTEGSLQLRSGVAEVGGKR